MSTKMRPWLKFYTSDWRADPGLRMCSYAARGLWMDILSIMHEAEPYGHLVINGAPPSAADLAALLGGSGKEVDALLATLERRGVFSRNDAGTIFSRRMIRDAEQAERDKANGKDGGNPRLKPPNNPTPNGGVNPSHNQTINGEDKAHSASHSQSQKEKEKAATHASASARQPKLAAKNPTLNDPPESWIHLAEKMSKGAIDGIEHPAINGNCLDIIAEKVCELSGINGNSGQVDWTPLVAWLRDKYEPEEHIYPVIRRLAGRPNYQPPRFLSYFDAAIRQARAA